MKKTNIISRIFSNLVRIVIYDPFPKTDNQKSKNNEKNKKERRGEG